MSFKIINLEEKNDVDSFRHYWNDEKIEKSKVFDVMNNGFNLIEKSSKYNNLLKQLKNCCYNSGIFLKNDNILSIGSGVCWIESQWLIGENFIKLSCIYYSKHRIHKIAPFVFKNYCLEKKNINLIHGHFFNFINYTNEKYHIVLLCQAFHHFNNPIRLLKEIKNKLMKNGKIIIVGEPYHSNISYYFSSLKHFIKYCLNWNGYKKNRNLLPSWTDLFPRDLIKGDIHWTNKEYLYFFKKSGLSILNWQIHKKDSYQSFVLNND